MDSQNSKKSPLIFNIQRFSIHDGGGIRTIIFFKGCALHCPWCSNPEGISAKRQLLRNDKRCLRCSATDAYHCTNSPQECPVNALSYCGDIYSIEQLVEEVARDQIMYDEDDGGLTLSGGEPLLYPEFLKEFLPRLKPWMNSIAVETSGNIPFHNIHAVLPYIDLFLYDLKILDSHSFHHICGGNLATVISNLEQLVSLKKRVIPRIPLVPTFTDSPANIEKIAALVATLGVDQVHLLPFHQVGSVKYEQLQIPYTLSELNPPTADQIAAAVHRFQSKGLHVIVGGL